MANIEASQHQYSSGYDRTTKTFMLPWQQLSPWYPALACFLRLPLQHCPLICAPTDAADQWAIALMPPKQGRLHSLSNYYSPLAGPRLPAKAVGWREFFAAVCTEQSKIYQVAIEPIDQASNELIKSTSIPGWRCRLSPISINWSATAENYWQRRPSQLTNTIRRKTHKLKAAGAHWQVHHQISEALRAAYWQVYQRSWKPAEPTQTFINTLFDAASQQGTLRLGVLWLNDEPIAAQCWLVAGGSAAIYKLAQDQAYDALSPGTVLTAAMLEQVLQQDQVQRLDFLTGNDDYKAMWMDSSEPLYRLQAYRIDTFRGLLQYSVDLVKTWLSQWRSNLRTASGGQHAKR